ncbi:MAG: DUF3180 domain-containing protein [bacterium]|nr:DUF3180 domain-containing protein [bacterium]
MSRTSWVTIVGAFVVAAMGSYAVFVLAQGMGAPTPRATWLTHAFMAVITLWVFVRGRAVRQMVEGGDTNMTPLEAARIAMMAKTAAVVGSLLAGYFAAVALFVMGLPSAPVRVELLISGLVGILVAGVMVVVGILVEGWCRIDPPDEDGPGGREPTAPTAA